MRFSVLIPLEFHRGLAERCIRAWCTSQVVPGSAYEVLVAAPADHDRGELARVASVLRPQDRLLELPHKHDMPLVAEAARQARGDVLVFTEAHCLPEGDFLAQAEAVLSENPSWAGFSGRSVPITHNLLSEIEAEMYAEDIARNMREHGWLKVLDQCFVIRRAAYLASGGIEPEYGHFAEWLFAARLHKCGAQVGYDERPAIQHYYVGDLADLEEFTADFARGQMIFAESAAHDACGNLFEDVPEWTERYEWDPAVAREFLRMLRCDFLGLWLGPGLLRRLRAWPWSATASWVARGYIPESLREAAREFRSRRARAALEKALSRGNKAEAKRLFLRLVGLWVATSREKFLREWRDPRGRSGNRVPLASGEWRASRVETVPVAGFHALETFDRNAFRWSKPAAMVKLLAPAGDFTVTVRWAFGGHEGVRFYADGVPVATERIRREEGFAELSLRGSGRAMAIGWVCPRFGAPGDGRQLGVPVVSITPRHASSAADMEPLPEAQRKEAFYFLHLRKCGGTALRLVLDNAQSAAETLGSFDASWFYYHDQLHGYRGVRADYKFAAGHFGWELPALVPGRDWRVATVFRDPARRLLSSFSYLQQLDQIAPKVGFLEWLHDDLKALDLTLPYFVPGMLARGERGARDLSAVSQGGLREAMDNLGRCIAVGLQERMDDAVDLLCWHQGSLPPEQLSRINETEARERVGISADEVARIVRELLPCEYEIYERAVKLSTQQLDEMQRSLDTEAGRSVVGAQRREYLRRRFFARRTAGLGRATVAGFTWGPGDAFLGGNLHAREEHVGRKLRWTGPHERTTFYAPLAPSPSVEVKLALHPATPRGHAESVQVFVNGAEGRVDVRGGDGGFSLRATVAPPPPRDSLGAFSEITLVSPTVREAGGFRELGIALCGVEIAPA